MPVAVCGAVLKTMPTGPMTGLSSVASVTRLVSYHHRTPERFYAISGSGGSSGKRVEQAPDRNASGGVGVNEAPSSLPIWLFAKTALAAPPATRMVK